MQGGGLDPLLYTMAINLVHLAVVRSRLGIPVSELVGDATVGTLGCVKNT